MPKNTKTVNYREDYIWKSYFRHHLHFLSNWSNMIWFEIKTKLSISIMKIILNGQNKEFQKGQTLDQVIALSCKNTTRVIVELNGEIIKSPMWHNIALQEGDKIELVGFVGGG